MPRCKRICIVNSELIFTEDDLKEFEFTERIIINATNEKEKTVEFLAKLGLIGNHLDCEICRNPMSLVRIKRNQSPFVWVCSKPCRRTTSIMKNSFFEKLNIPLDRFLLMVYKYFKSEEINEISRELDISRKTNGNLFDFIREIIENDMGWNQVRIGGLDENGNKKNS